MGAGVAIEEMSQLSAALKDILEKRGVLSEVQAKLRAEVYKALDDQGTEKPKLCRENLLINELIREYLVYNQYRYTNSVLLAESGQPEEPLGKDFLARELNLNLGDEDSSMPLLYRMLAYFLQGEDLKDVSTNIPAAMMADGGHLGEFKSRTGGTCTVEEPTYHYKS